MKILGLILYIVHNNMFCEIKIELPLKMSPGSFTVRPGNVLPAIMSTDIQEGWTNSKDLFLRDYNPKWEARSAVMLRFESNVLTYWLSRCNGLHSCSRHRSYSAIYDRGSRDNDHWIVALLVVRSRCWSFRCNPMWLHVDLSWRIGTGTVYHDVYSTHNIITL